MSKVINPNILQCPQCKSDNLHFGDILLHCSNCNSNFFLKNNKYYFQELTKDNISDNIDKIKNKFKKYEKFYRFLIRVISPVCPTVNEKKIIDKFVKDENAIALNLGSGSYDLSKKVSNLDIFDYECVDIICDIENLPIKSNSVDFIINIAVLEHVTNPEKVVEEINRVLKVGGIVCSYIPFIQPFHASPFDFSRRTYEGMKVLFKDFDIIELKCGGGPVSGFLWVFQELLSLIFSFGIKKLHIFLSLFFMVITFPIKFLDFIFIHHPMAKNISSAFFIIAKKNNLSN
ncbi:MAG: class I SAM-dependent methyltransferase [Candidatus Woesearchaeota archaeon]